MVKKLNWEAPSSNERISAIDEIKRSIIRCDEYIINFNMYSDLAMSLSIEIVNHCKVIFQSCLSGQPSSYYELAGNKLTLDPNCYNF